LQSLSRPSQTSGEGKFTWAQTWFPEASQVITPWPQTPRRPVEQATPLATQPAPRLKSELSTRRLPPISKLPSVPE